MLATSLFAGLAETDVQGIAAGHLKRIQAGEFFFIQGDPAERGGADRSTVDAPGPGRYERYHPGYRQPHLDQWEEQGMVDVGREKVVVAFPHDLVCIAED
jgi:hypothetical protein